MRELKCPKCKTLTIRDEHNAYERCLNCGWYRKIEPNDYRINYLTKGE